MEHLFWHSVVECLGEAVLGVDREGKISFLNHAAEQLLGRKNQEVSGSDIHLLTSCCSPRESGGHLPGCWLIQAIRGRQVTTRLPEKFARADGRDIQVQVVVSPCMGPNDAFQGSSLLVRDVTDDLRKEKALQESERKFRIVANVAPQIVWTCDASGVLVYANDRWFHYTGKEKGNPASLGWQGVVLPEDLVRAHAAWQKCVRTQSLYELEIRLRRHDGEYRWHLIRALPVTEGGRTADYWCGTTTDIHDQKETIEQLREERMVRERFVATLTHDLKLPLTSVRAGSELLQKFYEKNEFVDRLLRKMIHSIDRATEMIENLLDVNRVTIGRPIDLRPEKFCLNSLVREVVDDFLLAHGDRFRVQEYQNLEGFWCKRSLRRVLENLLTNAVKYGEKGSIIKIAIGQDGACVYLSISNKGPPIPRAEKEKIFQPFFRSSAVRNTKKEGWGLGLTLVRGIIQAHGGIVRLARSDSKGTTFTVELPLDARRKMAA